MSKLNKKLKLIARHFNFNHFQVLVLFTDHKICLRQDKELVKDQVTKIKEMGIKLVPVGIGPHINIRELERINNEGHEIMHFGEYADPRSVGKTVWHGRVQLPFWGCRRPLCKSEAWWKTKCRIT